ncbi:coiled-coil domain-containing protein 15 isoform X6 [Passer montanus]|uniref:coiled-coil domain-containing protein 15 isoform X6 n=1 Tax=Passer montanus TaxID=9160 RepID=UPI0019611384|nr:coiled-coil domain-containing protein 15 isoform X6 [Passer montanus]
MTVQRPPEAVGGCGRMGPRRAGMVPPPEEPPPRRQRRGWRVLAERNQSVAAVGAWVESAPGRQSPAFASASRVEKELQEQQRRKAASLRRFQGEVRQRVNRQARLRRRLELQKAYEAVERESCAAVQYSTPWKNTCLFQSLPAPIICAPSAGSGPAQPQEEHGEPFQQQAAELSRAVQQVRRRLASRRILARQQRQSEFLRCRRLCMALERECARQHRRQHQRQQRVARIKRQKENQRRAEEQRMQDMAEQREPSPGEAAWEALAQLQLEERRVRDRQQRDKEHMRYVEALRAQMREKVKLCNIDLPPLCSCGSDFWDSHPDTCANNCVFYKNHKAYSQALHSVISGCAHAATRSLQDVAALCARSGKRL